MSSCNPADECDVCGRCTMCRPCDPLYDHGDPLPENPNVTVNVRAKAEGTLRAFLRNLGINRTTPTIVECDPDEFIHRPDEHTATHYPDGVLHTFTGPNHDGHTRAWRVATRRPENPA